MGRSFKKLLSSSSGSRDGDEHQERSVEEGNGDGYYSDDHEHQGELDGGGSNIHAPLLVSASYFTSSLYDLEKAHLCSYQKEGVSFARSAFNATNALTGIGVLSMPYALSQGGWLSLLFFLAIAIIFCYTGRLIQRCMDADPAINSYVDLAEMAFGLKGKVIVAVIMCLELYISGVSHLILEGDNLDKLLPDSSIQIFSLTLSGKTLFIIAAALVFLPTTWLRSLSVLAYFSAVGVFSTLILFLTLLWIGITETGFHAHGGKLFDLSGLPVSLGLYSMCFCGHAVFPTIYKSMKDVTHFSKTLVVSFTLGALSCGSVAILGYLMYGSDLQSQVTLNLPDGQFYSKIAIFTTIVTPLTKYPWMIIIAMAIEEQFSPDGKGSPNIFLRTVMVAGTLAIALAVPSFQYIMAFIGSFLGISVSVLLPCLCYLKIFKIRTRSGGWSFEFVKIVCILAFGAVISVFGTYSSVKGMITDM